MNVIYRRTLEVSASHFNNQDTYERYGEALLQASEEKYEAAFDNLMAVLHDCHGHNFIYNIEAVNPVMADPASAFVIDDDRLVAIVHEWKDCNVTIHEDFDQWEGRVTLELMCVVLKKKLHKAFGCEFKVTISETRDINATA